jgi:hypothetical protein
VGAEGEAEESFRKVPSRGGVGVGAEGRCKKSRLPLSSKMLSSQNPVILEGAQATDRIPSHKEGTTRYTKHELRDAIVCGLQHDR